MANKLIKWHKDLEFEIRPKVFPNQLRPVGQPWKDCIITTDETDDLNKRCKDCVFSQLSNKSRGAHELGIGGYMSNVDENKATVNALKPTKTNATIGLNKRIPMTQIIQHLTYWRCKHGKQRNIDRIGSEIVSCEHYLKREKEKE